jgi:hypothetical protein|tara:strand:- start:1833 stop:2402 length:570 start_codon:yes stop_codon:yes gene_type:complete
MLKTVTSVVNVSQITGVLPVVNGGTGVTTSTGTGNVVLSAAPTLSGNVNLSTGNLVMGTDGKGIDFSATAGTGTSELLNDYEEGAWTPVDSSGAGLVFLNQSGKYTKIGRQVTANGQLAFPATISAADIVIGGLPFTVGTYSVGTINNADVVFTITAGATFFIYDVAGTRKTNVNYSGLSIYFTIVYFV